MKAKRSQYVTAIWTRASTAFPGNELSPTDYGWSVTDNLLQPVWFQGCPTPEELFAGHPQEDDSDKETAINAQLDIDDDQSLDSDEAWSEDSDLEPDEDTD